ncbi:hypothetical protein P5673_020105 [Acropora cervicornis]|uniref:Uncharacterized protein n=1 Tax=Acropora cervicornis TaxID=6130 RepID=A0AAD9QBD0_ACRCE|nr:hypothetical protein P5673_020105 [Acropora cervicornis]
MEEDIKKKKKKKQQQKNKTKTGKRKEKNGQGKEKWKEKSFKKVNILSYTLVFSSIFKSRVINLQQSI